jgi:nucleotide-binding universal stress UspA family protein
MTALKTLMVCLDLTEMDDLLIRYAAYFSQAIPDVDRILFFHNIRFDYPESAGELLSGIDRPLHDVLTDIVKEQVSEHMHMREADTPFEVIITEDDSTPRAMAHTSSDEGADLIILGKKVTYKGSGLVAEMLYNIPEFAASILLVPETAYHQINDILVPTDFSKASRTALAFGHYLQRQFDASLECQHVYNIPAHYFPYIKVEDMQDRMEQEARDDWRRFVRNLPENERDVSCTFTFSRDDSVSEAIYNYALQEKKDFVIVNSKGRGGLASFLIGSVALRLIQLDSHLPLLVTNNRGKRKGSR